MKIRTLSTVSAAALAAIAGIANAGPSCEHDHGACVDSESQHSEQELEYIAKRLIHSLPIEHQAKIQAAHGIGSDALQIDLSHFITADELPDRGIPEDITPREYRDMIVSDELEARMTDFQRTALERMVEQLEAGIQPPAMCFTPDADSEFVDAINRMMELRFQIAFQQTSRWTATATNGAGLGQGDPTTLTYSFVPDGTFCPNIIGVTGNSNLRSWLNGIYGNQATWQALFEQVFDRWEELCGVSYVYEPNDDGVNLNNAVGVLGVRGDVRIAAITIDGNSNTLAYNNFPNDGDMVFDSADNFFNSTGSNSIRFRNVTAHEHGHGLGMLHVCPANGTKLMEPFVSTAYDGPQLDDILNGQRHYGDNNEPNDNAASSTFIGAFGVGGFDTFDNVSVDDNSDRDVYRITLNEPARATFLVEPDADTYVQGPQTSSCSGGTSTNFNVLQDLRVAIYDSPSLIAPVAFADDTSEGSSESLVFDGTAAGDYYLVIDSSSGNNSIQRYRVATIVADLPFLVPQIAAAAPSSVDPGVSTEFSVTIDPRDDTLVGSPVLFTRVNGGSYSSSALTSNGGTSYTASIPGADCEDTVEFYISAEGDVGGVITLPAGGASEPFAAEVGETIVAIEDDFETNMGWSVSGSVTTAAAGMWQRGIPVGASDSRVSDADSDFDGSGRCYVTGNVLDNSDVDGGDTILTSPAFDVSGNPEATVSYARWFDNNEGGDASNPFTETFVIEISDNNGSSWTNLETVGPNGSEVSGGWFVKEFRIADFVSTTDQVRVRFIASDDNGTIVEAGVDAFSVTGLVCEDPVEDCRVDFTMDGTLDFFDLSAFLTAFNNMDPAADFTDDGSFDFFDLSLYLTEFGNGCP